MISTPTPQLEIPNELRAVAEQRIEQAKGAFSDFMRAAQGAVSALEDRFMASEAGTNEIGDKAMSFAGRNVSSAFDFAQKRWDAVRAGGCVRLWGLRREHQAAVEA